MKKKMIYAVIAIFWVLFASVAVWFSCGMPGLASVAEKTMPDSWQLEPDTIGTIEPCGVNMTASILPDKRVAISISNETELFLEFDRGADVQIRKFGQWFTISSAMSDPVKLDLFELAPAETWTGDPFALLSSNESFPSGEYRAVKRITLRSDAQEEQVIYTACVFNI